MVCRPLFLLHGFIGKVLLEHKSIHFLFKKIFYLFIFRERGREGEREGEKHQCVVASRTTPTGGHGLQPRPVP